LIRLLRDETITKKKSTTTNENTEMVMSNRQLSMYKKKKSKRATPATDRVRVQRDECVSVGDDEG
jgi:CRISPR/Cas system CMR-associated protein Cmr3 (group 5 of RAMP superfamily)